MSKAQFVLAMIAMGLLDRSEAGFLPRRLNDPNLVHFSPNCSFYVVSVDSTQWYRFGLVGAPVVAPSKFNQGEGVDVLAIPFDPTGRVTFAPVYIYTIQPEQYRLRKMRGLVQGYTSKTDVEQLMDAKPIKRRIR